MDSAPKQRTYGRVREPRSRLTDDAAISEDVSALGSFLDEPAVPKNSMTTLDSDSENESNKIFSNESPIKTEQFTMEERGT